MRILNMDTDQAVNSVLLLLNPAEAKELADKIRQLTPENGDHMHINDDTFMREITVAIYTPENTQTFNHRVIELIENGI
jgi:hypothetical protein